MRILKRLAFVALFLCQHANGLAAGFQLLSSAFQMNEPIPSLYTCQGDNISPSLAWLHTPLNTQSFALIMNDPGAANGNWVHWMVFNIPSNLTKLDSNVPLPIEAVTGLNSFNTNTYAGPCPPAGNHHYFFRLYALDTVLQISTTAQYDDLINAMQGHVLGEAWLTGTYSKH